MRIRLFDIMLFTGLIVIQITSLAQDFHFSMNQLSPLNLNPAIVGNFDGDLRINSNHRSQWSAVTIPYSTYSISADLNTKKQLPIGFIISSILSNRKLEDLDTEVQDLRSQRQLLKEEIFRLSKSRKPQPRKRRNYKPKPRNTRKKI